MSTKEYIPQAESTNTLLRQRTDCPEGLCLYTFNQTAGRGQRGNHWECEAGKNLAFSLCLHPQELLAGEHFLLSEQVALAVADALDKVLLPIGKKSAIKWPNDAYVEDKKISGTLIENTLSGSRIDRSIIGIGINVNQTEFLSDAPNPVSLRQLTGHEHDLEAILDYLLERITYWRQQDLTFVQEAYLGRLYRREGWHWFEPLNTQNPTLQKPFLAQITAIRPDGGMELTQKNGEKRTFYFKEVKFLEKNLVL